jgi:glutathione synthase/RimK-type ligase-like ATP-grasp enzyme
MTRSWSKWSKHKSLMESAALAPHLPKTHRLEQASLWRLLDKYGEVIIKPTGSWGGKGVFRIKETGADKYEVHDGDRKKPFKDRDALNEYISKHTKKDFLVQQRIKLASVNRRPFDLRVMVQRHPKSNWEVTGRLAKIAGKGYIVTNVQRSHGSIQSVEYAITHSDIKGPNKQELIAQIDRVALLAAKQLKKHHPNRRIMGIDMGIDKQGHVWIIEVNFTPMKGLFLKLKDKSMYRKIKSF